ncbi:MAG: hypothetical protein HQL59_09725 [Magnetococcales bacterium]|nr:hypothetical protein [Magnetococcales bacterium]
MDRDHKRVSPHRRISALAAAAIVSLTTAGAEAGGGVPEWTYPNPSVAWGYPNTSQEQEEEVASLKASLAVKNEEYQARQAEAVRLGQELVEQQALVESEDQALRRLHQPIADAQSRYAKAQQVSLYNPSISTEKERLEFLGVIEKLRPAIQEQENKLAMAKDRVKQLQTQTAFTQGRIPVLMRETETLMKQMDLVTEMAFVKITAD